MRYSDEDIKKNVVDQLYWDDRVDASNITVVVMEGKVTLRGTVPTYFAYECAEEDALAVTGVAQIDNQIEIRYPDTIPLPTDEELRNRLTAILALNPDIHAEGIQVRVDQGVITLDGVVPAIWQKQHAGQVVARERGVIRIVNQLETAPARTHSDRDIADDIGRALRRKGIEDIQNLTVNVREGVVTLTGTVQDNQRHGSILRTALFTPGVVDVIDRLQVVC
jgi:osmotically-inducible protein OsmY